MVKPPQIKSLAHNYQEHIQILVYGDSGAGKTVLAGTMPSGIILATEKGTDSAAKRASQCDVWPCPNWEEVVKAYRWLRRENGGGYEWLAIDSMPEMQMKLLRWILATGVTHSKKGAKGDPDVPQIQDHQKWQNMFKRYVGQFNDLPMNVLWTATPMNVETADGDDLVLPAIQGKGYAISQWACAAQGIVGRLSVRKGKEGTYRLLRCEYDPPYFGKSRYDEVLSVRDPNIAEIAEALKNGKAPQKTVRRTRTARPRKATANA